MEALILTLDQTGLPQAWVSIEDAITYHAKQLVAWSAGNYVCEYRGGVQRDGRRSRIETQSILALRGASNAKRLVSRAPVLSNGLLFARDRNVCAYCGVRFGVRELSCDHVLPVSKAGKHVWMNAVTACRACNIRKADRTPEQARMPLLYVPYTPNRHEQFILRNRHILVDQMKFLLVGVPRCRAGYMGSQAGTSPGGVARFESIDSGHGTEPRPADHWKINPLVGER